METLQDVFDYLVRSADRPEFLPLCDMIQNYFNRLPHEITVLEMKGMQFEFMLYLSFAGKTLWEVDVIMDQLRRLLAAIRKINKQMELDRRSNKNRCSQMAESHEAPAHSSDD
jgi:hypothetical protein